MVESAVLKAAISLLLSNGELKVIMRVGTRVVAMLFCWVHCRDQDTASTVYWIIILIIISVHFVSMQVEEIPGVKIFGVQSPIYYANGDYIKDSLYSKVGLDPLKIQARRARVERRKNKERKKALNEGKKRWKKSQNDVSIAKFAIFEKLIYSQISSIVHK